MYGCLVSTSSCSFLLSLSLQILNLTWGFNYQFIHVFSQFFNHFWSIKLTLYVSQQLSTQKQLEDECCCQRSPVFLCAFVCYRSDLNTNGAGSRLPLIKNNPSSLVFGFHFTLYCIFCSAQLKKNTYSKIVEYLKRLIFLLEFVIQYGSNVFCSGSLSLAALFCWALTANQWHASNRN